MKLYNCLSLASLLIHVKKDNSKFLNLKYNLIEPEVNIIDYYYYVIGVPHTSISPY